MSREIIPAKPQQICPDCLAANPSQNRYCGRCGAALAGFTLAPSPSRLPVPAQDRLLRLAQAPAVQTAAVSLGVILLRSGLAWLRRRAARRLLPSWPAAAPEISPRAIFEPEPGARPRHSESWARITVAWWEILVESPRSPSGDELDRPER